MNKTIQLLSWFSIISALVVIGLLVYWATYPYKTVTFSKTVFPVLNENKTVQVGGYLNYEVDYCKYTKAIPLISKTFIDGILYTIPETIGTELPIGCRKMTVQLYVPKALPPGSFHVSTVYRYKVNPIRTIDITVATEGFTVVK